MSTYFYVYPWGTTQTPVTIPIDSDAPSLSYQDGYTINYEYDYPTNPAAIPIPRNDFNQLMYDVTNNIREYQTNGTPLWITASQNQGTSFPYPIYARVYYNNLVYENQVANNTATPGADNTWLLISGNAAGIQPGTVIDFGGPIPPVGYLATDGTDYPRTTYGALFAAITQIQTGTTTASSYTVTGLSSTTQMYAGEPIEGSGIPSRTLIATIVSNTSITMTQQATAGASIPITFFNWGNGDGATTFNVPALGGYVTAGQAGQSNLGITPNSTVVGQKGGVSSVVLTTGNMPAGVAVTSKPPVVGNQFINSTGTSSYPSVSSSSSAWSSGAATATNIVQPTSIMYKCIKY